jgi:hypothetical protein
MVPAKAMLTRSPSAVLSSSSAGFEQHDVAGHQLAGVDLDDLAVALHLAGDRDQPLQGLRGALGVEFLEGADARVDQQHGKDEAGVRVFAQ